MGGACQCCTPRKSAPRRRRKTVGSDKEKDNQKRPTVSSTTHKQPPSTQILARLAELRPVLPKPSNRSVFLAGPTHDPSSNVSHSHAMRHYTRDNMVFSPYGRAYDMSHGSDIVNGSDNEQQNLPQTSSYFAQATQPPDIPANVESWLSTTESFPSTCKCGEGCSCPGCVEHNGNGIIASGTTAFSSCANPGACSHCLDCAILSLPASLPQNTSLSIYDPSEAQNIDEWIRQISAQPASSDFSPSSSLPPDLGIIQDMPWDTFRAPRISEPTPNNNRSECCSGQCQCSPTSCACPQDCCGCCQGCVCVEHEHAGSNARGLTFATSGERGACCSGAVRKAARSLVTSNGQGGSRGDIPFSRMPIENYLTIPDTSRSRSSSTSSQSVSESPYSPDFLAMFATPRPTLPTGLPSSGSSSSASSAPYLHIGSSSSNDISPQIRTSDDHSMNVTYATSVPDSESSDDQQFENHSQYDPSLDGAPLY